jgi:hypothetical protein
VRFRHALVPAAVALTAAATLASPAYAASPAAAPTDKCSLHVNIPHPVAGDEETLKVTSTTANTVVKVVIQYKTVSHTWRFSTGPGKQAAFPFGVGRPTKGWKVTLSGTVVEAPGGYKHGTCQTDFVPR